ncbi:hypothetical protein MUS1_14240 [Marinomonas ushuaiensis DSM 15871]|uniref:Histidine kinase n=1 Tax=Marinomonas ushuaiensis DSM 15871 TaxID=1122207 RepID=X7E6C4_9GAMM|nr:AhpA/YtjB family protein [Marinomonas ushuaiensis]ETX10741.1 hypothetical protein MUS1_14240 [Marinomonas ushuaiensis DSM 15871]
MDTQPKIKMITAFVRKKLSASVVTVATFLSLMILTVCIFWYTMTHALGNYLSQQTEVLGSSLATQAAFNATQSILSNDLLSLNVLLNRLVVDDNILSARVYNKKDELLAEANSSGSGMQSEQDYRPGNGRRVYSSSIKFRDDIVGHVLITIDKTPAQATLLHLNNLLIGVAIFISAITLLLVLLMTKWLFSPITEASSAIIAYSQGKKSSPLDPAKYKEAREIHQAVESIQNLEHSAPVVEKSIKAAKQETPNDEKTETKEAQFEMNFDALFEESKQRNCVLYFDILNLEEWHKNMTPLQVANLLTPIYRAIFQASEVYLGQVHQHKNDSAIIFFSAMSSEDNLYLNAVSTAQLFLGLMEKLLENELYKDTPKLNFHLGLHQGNSKISNMIKENNFKADEIEDLLNDMEQMKKSESVNKLVISDDIFTLSHIQNRVFSGLPEIIESNEKEILAYEVKGMSDKYKAKIQQHIIDIAGIIE